MTYVVVHILGRIFSGWLADRDCVDPVKLNMAALLIGSAINIVIPFTNNYYILIAEAAVFGLSMGKYTYSEYLTKLFLHKRKPYPF